MFDIQVAIIFTILFGNIFSSLFANLFAILFTNLLPLTIRMLFLDPSSGMGHEAHIGPMMSSSSNKPDFLGRLRRKLDRL